MARCRKIARGAIDAVRPAAAEIPEQVLGSAVISVGADGTDSPTDAAGGYVDTMTLQVLKEKGLDDPGMLDNNDSYHARLAINGLIITVPTGTNVNDISIGLLTDCR